MDGFNFRIPNKAERLAENVTPEKLAADFADLAEAEAFTQIEILAQQMKEKLGRANIIQALEQAQEVISDRQLENPDRHPNKLEWQDKLGEISLSFHDGGQNGTD